MKIHIEIDAIADGVLGKVVMGRVEYSHLVVIEAKKGIDNKTPVFQLYGQLLAAAYLNWVHDTKPKQEIFGCYTIADIWKMASLLKNVTHGYGNNLITNMRCSLIPVPQL